MTPLNLAVYIGIVLGVAGAYRIALELVKHLPRVRLRKERGIRCGLCHIPYLKKDLWFNHDFGCKVKGCDHGPECGLCIMQRLPNSGEDINLNFLLKIGAEE